MTKLFETTWSTSEPDRFGRALLVAFGIEVVLIFMLASQSPPSAPVAPQVVKLQMLPPAPVEHAKPPPPQPQPPTPQPAVPMTPPVPVPPPLPPKPDHPVMHTKPHPLPPPPKVITAPLPPATVTEAPPPSPEAQQTALSRYTGMLRAIVLSHLEVPDDISSAGITSTCTLRFTVAPDGSILSVGIAGPSGLASVNQAALSALRGSRFPGFLTNMPNHPIEFILPVRVSGDSG
ncbi:MAG TPA: TonB family protein [Acidocella sp.]|nr:TonB family protein [Acidocella sp.]